MKKIISIVFIPLIISSIMGCGSNTEYIKSAEPAKSENADPVKSENLIESGIRFYVYADKYKTNIEVTFEKSSKLNSFQIEFNGQKLTNRRENDGRIYYTEAFENYEKINRFLITKPDGKQNKFEVTVEPLDFQVTEPFTIHRLKANQIKISRPYFENQELWLGITDNYLGGFKEIAEFNQTKDSIVIPESVSKRLSVGDAKISLHNVEIKKVENDLFNGTFHVSYESEIKLKVVK